MYRENEFTLVDALSTGHHESDRLSDAINLPYNFVDEAERLASG